MLAVIPLQSAIYHSCVYMAYKNMGKLLIKKKTEEQVCHDFDPIFAPLCCGERLI